MEKMLDEFIITCENNMICFAEDYGMDILLDETALEGPNMDIARLIKADEVKMAKSLVKEAKKLNSQKEFTEAIKKLTMAKTLIRKMKSKVDSMPEPASKGDKFLSYFTPIFTTMPTEKLDKIRVIPIYGRDGISFHYEFTYIKLGDKMSAETTNNVKARLQFKFNLYLNNLEVTIKSYAEAKRFYETKMKKKEDKK